MNALKYLQLVAVAILLGAGSVTGCVDSKHPMSAPETAEIHDGILGVWVWKGSGVKDDEWTITPAGKGFPKGLLRITAVSEGNQETVIAFSTKLNNQYYLNVVNFQDETVPETWDKTLVKSYTLMPYSITENIFIGVSLDKDFIAKAIHAKRVAGRFPRTEFDAEFSDTAVADGNPNEVDGQDLIDEMQLTASTQELREFFSKLSPIPVGELNQKGLRKVAQEKNPQGSDRQ